MSDAVPVQAGRFRPDPTPASAVRRVWAFTRWELKIVLGNGEQLLLAVVIPVAVLIGLSRTSVGSLPAPRIQTVAPGALALAALSGAFTSQAITTAFDRRYGVLKRLAAAGLSRTALLASKCLVTLAVLAGQCVILAAVAAGWLGWHPHGDVVEAVLVLLLGTAALVGIALLLGGVLRAEAVLAVANLVWLLLFAASGLAIPLDHSPGWLRVVGGATPTGALVDGLRAVLRDGHHVSAASWLILLAWTAVGWAGTVRWFRWL